jgi:hypothetical protein
MMSRSRTAPILALAVVLLTAAGVSSQSPSPTSDPSASPTAGQLGSDLDELVGEWRRDQACDELLNEFASLGLDEYAAQFLVGVGIQDGPEGRVRELSDPCEGARPVARRLVFSPDGRWGGFVEATGEQVDCCEFRFVAPGLIELPGDPATILRFEVMGDAVTFVLQWPDPCEDDDCRSQVAWATETFTLGPWQRVGSAAPSTSARPSSLV